MDASACVQVLAAGVGGASAAPVLAATGGLLTLLVPGALLVAALAARRTRAVLAVALAVAATIAALPLSTSRPAQAATGCVMAGADRSNIAPFTADAPQATAVDPLSARTASNPDGRPGGLWDQIAGVGSTKSAGQVTVSGLWGEPFVDGNGNRRYDQGETFTDDAVNSAIDTDSLQHYDGIRLGGFGNDRIPRGVFDPIWARTVFVADGTSGKTVALTVLDFIGYFSDRIPIVLQRAKALEPKLNVDAWVVAHTHDHQSPDMVGLWGTEVAGAVPRDGTYPKYERYVEEKLARSLVAAFHAARPARFRAGAIRAGETFATLRGNAENLAGLQVKGTCRTPWFFDDELRAFQLEGVDGRTVATGLNWGMHVESMEDGNQYLSSDNAGSARDELEQAFGGVALYTQGAQGSIEVVGDSCTQRWRRDTFDGERFAVKEDGRPVAFTSRPGSDEWIDPVPARQRTYALGRVIGSAAVAALRRAAWDADPRVEVIPPKVAYLPANNGALLAVTAAGTIDKPSYLGGLPLSASERANQLGKGGSLPSGFDVKTTFYAWRIGSASFVTAPGEMFPELYEGVGKVNRSTPTGEYVKVNPAALACAARPFAYSDDPTKAGANTGRPYEPGVRDVQVKRFGTRTNFIVGYAPDLLGYIVPGYDFSWYVAPAVEGLSLGSLQGEAPDPCQASVPDLAFPKVHYGSHYHETNSASSVLAGGVVCNMLELLGDTAAANTATCRELSSYRNAVVGHIGVGPTGLGPDGSVPVGHY
jgi:hypothetical protein